MNLVRLFLFACCAMVWQVTASEVSLAPELEPFKPLFNTWQGELAQPGKATKVDVSRWERALNGQAVRITHSVDHGEYGGETMLFWDKTKQSLVYYYFTTAGFYTHGTMHIDAQGQKFIAEEDVANNPQGITKVRSITSLVNGKMTVRSEYLKNGNWQPGHSATYTPTATQQPEFR